MTTNDKSVIPLIVTSKNSYPAITTEVFLRMIRADEWEDRDGNTPLTKRIHNLNQAGPAFSDQETALIEELVSIYPEEIDGIAAARLIRYLSEIRHNRAILFRLLQECIFSDLIPTSGKAVFALYLLENYYQDFQLAIEVHDTAWVDFLFDLNRTAPLQLLRILSFTDKRKARELTFTLLDTPENEDDITDFLVELAHEDRPLDTHFRTWVIDLIKGACPKISPFNKKALHEALSMLTKGTNRLHAPETNLFARATQFYDDIAPQQAYRRNQINRSRLKVA